LLAILVLLISGLTVCRVQTARRETRTPEEEAPVSGHFVSAGDIQLYIKEQGPQTGLPVVFIHGFGAWSETWSRTTTALAAQGFHAVALDVPPFGFSEKVTNEAFSRNAQARRIIKVLDALKLGQVILVGHSIGARPTVEAALLAPERIKALVLVNGALGFGNDGEFAPNDPTLLARAFFAVRPLRNAVLSATATNPLMTKKLLSTFVANPDVLTPALLSVYQKPFVVKNSTNRLGDWLKVLSIDNDTSLSNKLSNFSKLAMPTLLIWGDKDTITPLWQAEKLRTSIPGASLSVLKGLGHIPQIEDPTHFNSSLLPFVEQVRR
jgi:pimeloyl-ACP methyl ester carboxylesterase